MQHPEPTLRRFSMHINHVREMAAVPDDPQQLVFQFLAPSSRGHAHRAHIVRVYVRVADNSYPRNDRQLFIGQFQQAALEIAGDPVVARGTGQPLLEELLMQAGAARTVAVQAWWVSPARSRRR